MMDTTVPVSKRTVKARDATVSAPQRSAALGQGVEDDGDASKDPAMDKMADTSVPAP